ncbi:MAG: hypothetical protein ACRCUY_11805 [Thermoguttaceae bacterium]
MVTDIEPWMGLLYFFDDCCQQTRQLTLAARQRTPAEQMPVFTHRLEAHQIDVSLLHKF